MFDCEEQSLNDYLQRFARKHSEKDVSQTHVLFDSQNKRIISYYSIVNDSIERESISSMDKFPVRKIPAVLIGRLAVDKLAKGKGYGGKALVEALKKVKVISNEIGIRIVVVDALNDSAKEFYKNFGFLEFDDSPMKLFVEMEYLENL